MSQDNDKNTDTLYQDIKNLGSDFHTGYIDNVLHFTNKDGQKCIGLMEMKEPYNLILGFSGFMKTI